MITNVNALATVENTPGAALPSTGGPGTNLLYLLGLFMILGSAAGILLRSRRAGR